MAMKRKLDLDSTEDYPQFWQAAKQLKLVPFPGYEPENDVAMSDSSSSDSEPFFPESHHTRLVSTVSSTSSTVDFDSPLYPRYNAHQPTLDPSESPKVIGLMQPASSLSHHGSHCSQIPKLRVACSASPDGSRTMWSFCEQCGAISMVDSD
ncbi:hypothetical protein BU15DRAFT_87216 [Melanogaster broomeanus]|nr:hypothetical protein BU15DRAFT_87216 [Melanogaster broomeanus]